MAIESPLPLDQHQGINAGDHDLSVAGAMRIAWMMWLTMLAIPFVLSMAVMFTLDWNSQVVIRNDAGRVWFVIALAWIGITGPLAFFVRGRIFQAFGRGEVVAPRHYLMGMMAIWLAFEIGGILSVVGVWKSQSLAPCIAPALLAFMLFTPFWPSGRAMTRPVGDVDDAEIYEDPR